MTIKDLQQMANSLAAFSNTIKDESLQSYLRRADIDIRYVARQLEKGYTWCEGCEYYHEK